MLHVQDLDSGHHGSGFPLPPFRAALLREHLAGQEARAREAARRIQVPVAEAAAQLKEKGMSTDASASQTPTLCSHDLNLHAHVNLMLQLQWLSVLRELHHLTDRC